MSISRIKIVLSIVLGLCFIAPPSYAGKKKKWHCEKEVDGEIKDLKKVKSRKKCKKMGGKWVKAHSHGHKDHDHSHGDHDHDH